MRKKAISRIVGAGIAGVIVALLGVGPASADAIDGDWCNKDGRRFSISGPQIVTPGGARTEGDYDRHAFAYKPPAPEPGAGQTIYMALIDENTVHLRVGEPASGPMQEVWERCSPSTS